MSVVIAAANTDRAGQVETSLLKRSRSTPTGSKED